MGAHWLVLGSSNSNREYVADVLEAMAVPVGFVMYFRYQKRWVEPSLWQQLPIKNSGAANALIGQKTLVVLPYGERPDPSKPVEFKQVYPVRVARIKEAHKTGTEDSDIAHFHFELSSYACRRPNTNLVQYLPEFNQGQFAYFREDITDIQQLDSQERDFLQVVNSLDPQHFKYFDATPFYPVFCCVRGLSGAKSSYNPEFRQLEYTLQEGHSQRVDVTLQLHQPPKSDSKLLWAFNEKQFAIVPRNEVEIASRYN